MSLILQLMEATPSGLDKLLAADNIAIVLLSVVLGWFMFRLENTLKKINDTIKTNTIALARAEKAMGNGKDASDISGVHPALPAGG